MLRIEKEYAEIKGKIIFVSGTNIPEK